MSTFDHSSRIGFLGAGLVGTCLSVALSQKGYKVVGVASRSHASAQALASQIPGCQAYKTPQEAADACDLAFVTTPDEAIGVVVATTLWRVGQGVVHCSGAESLDVLDSARTQGAMVGAFHPLQTFSSVEAALKSLPGITFAIEGEPRMRAFLEKAALALEGHPLRLEPGDKVLYHISAVMSCGFSVALINQATELWQGLGIGREEALRALLPLMRGTVDSLASVGIPQALTGPYARGDICTIRRHLEALEARAPGLLHLYCHLALAGLPVAVEKGKLSSVVASEIQALMEQYLDKAPSLTILSPQVSR